MSYDCVIGIKVHSIEDAMKNGINGGIPVTTTIVV